MFKKYSTRKEIHVSTKTIYKNWHCIAKLNSRKHFFSVIKLSECNVSKGLREQCVVDKLRRLIVLSERGDNFMIVVDIKKVLYHLHTGQWQFHPTRLCWPYVFCSSILITYIVTQWLHGEVLYHFKVCYMTVPHVSYYQHFIKLLYSENVLLIIYLCFIMLTYVFFDSNLYECRQTKTESLLNCIVLANIKNEPSTVMYYRQTLRWGIWWKHWYECDTQENYNKCIVYAKVRTQT